MGFPILVRWHLYIESGPWYQGQWQVFVGCNYLSLPLKPASGATLLNNSFAPHIASLKLEMHYSDVIMSALASQITGVSIVYSTVRSGADQRKQQSAVSPVNSPHKRPVTRKCFHLMTSSWEKGLGSPRITSITKNPFHQGFMSKGDSCSVITVKPLI